MGSMAYALDRGGPKRLGVTWRRGWKDFTVSLDGAQVAAFAGDLPLAGAATPLPDGSNLELALFRGTANGTVLELKRDGQPLPGATPLVDREGEMHKAGGYLYLAAGLSFVVQAAVLLLGRAPDAVKLFSLAFLVMYCGLLAFLGWRVRRGSLAAAIFAMGFFGLDWLATILLTHNPFSGIVIRLLVFVALYRAIKKMRQLRATREVTEMLAEFS